jgi:predicted anti-sigma-YlaC factor YlaD
MQHYSEADLLETYYTRPGESMPVMMHLADCSECAARYECLERKMQGLRACPHEERPETFWVRQRMQIMRKIDARRTRTASIARVTRIAAAAMLVLVLGALVTWRTQVDKPSSRQVVETAAVQTVPVEDSTTRALDTSSDPWQSDELKDYSSMVAWESWVEEGNKS